MSGEIWYPNNGGDCPVKEGVLIDIQHRDGSFTRCTPAVGPGVCDASYWRKKGRDQDIVAYRICSERACSDSLTPRIAAHEFLERGVKHMRDRAVQRDSDAGERSMARAVAAFNAQEGTNLTEAQGWRFMIQLKYARAVNGVFVADDYEDMAAYAGLAGEAAQ